MHPAFSQQKSHITHIINIRSRHNLHIFIRQNASALCTEDTYNFSSYHALRERLYQKTPHVIMADEKFEIKESDMEESEQATVIAVVREAQRLYNIDKDVAAYIKEELDKQLGATWHIICGKCFGSRVSYEMGHFLLLKCNNRVNVMVYKCGY